MKSIKQQYIDLQEGRMTQQNFMRNLRMTMPQYITNVTSYNDSIKILKNKGILTEADIKSTTTLDKLDESHDANEQWLDAFKDAVEKLGAPIPTEDENKILDKYQGKTPQQAAEEYADDPEHLGEPGLTGHMAKLARDLKRGLKEAKDEKGRWTNANGKSMYDQFKEIDNLNGQEVLIGIDYEIEKNHQLTKVEAAKIVIKNLKKNPIYYTSALMSGKEGYEPEYLGGKSANAEARQMQFVKGDNLVDKKMGMQPVKNIEKAKKDADARKETNKVVKGVEELTFTAKTVRGLKKFNPTGEKMKKVSISEGNLGHNEIYSIEHEGRFWIVTYRTADGTKEKSFQSEDKARKFASTLGEVKTIRESVDKALAKERLKEMIRQELKEITGAYGGDAMDPEDGSSYLEETNTTDIENKIKSGEINPKEVAAAAEKAMKGDSTDLALLMAGLKL